MKIQKKILAREIIILSSLLGLICLFYFGIEVWNWNVNRNIAKTEGTIRLINQDLAVNAQRIDSIKNQPKKGNDLNVSSNLTNDNALKDLWQGLTENISGFKVDFETFKSDMADPSKRSRLHATLTERGLYTKSKDEFEKQFFSSYLVKQDNPIYDYPSDYQKFREAMSDPLTRKPHKKLVFVKQDNPIYDFAKENGIEIYSPSSYERTLRILHSKEYSDMDYEDFRNRVIIKYGEYGRTPMRKDDIPILTQYLEIQTGKQRAKDSVNIVRNNYESNLIPNQNQTKLTFNFAFIGFLLVYVLRGIIFALKWSIKTLKEQ